MAVNGCLSQFFNKYTPQENNYNITFFPKKFLRNSRKIFKLAFNYDNLL